MKRPPQLWVITCIGILCVLPTVRSLKATSLIFKSTTTSTTEVPQEEETSTGLSVVSESPSTDANQTVTKPPLTGIPQIDYIWDPNLPFELKNYNLSDYPFYESIPEKIDFKCDGLHDGFYASVVHKCQVYHHCLFGTRYDFLCANFTAFDQKTFICHFASEVDCPNSPKYYHRNDALYKAAETTTVSTTTILSVVTPSPALNPALRRPIAALGGRRRRPYRRRRPQYDYYYDDEEYETDRGREDYYDDLPARPGGRRRRPRPNRRPDYDDYDDYEDERFDRRGTGRRDEDRERRPYDRRGEDDKRYDDRRPNKKGDPVEDDDEDRRDRRRPDDKKTPDDRRRTDDYERRPYDRRKPSRDRYDDKDDERRPYRARKPDDEDRRPRPKDPLPSDDKEERTHTRPKKDDEERRYRPKDDDKDDRRPFDRRNQDDDERRPRPASKLDESRSKIDDAKPLVRPSSSSVYDRPRASPVIRRPVPLSERGKYNYKSPVTTASSKPRREPEDEEYYDDYEDEPKLPPPKPTTRKPSIDSERTRGPYSRPRRPPGTRRPISDLEDEPKRPVDEIRRPIDEPRRPIDEPRRSIDEPRRPSSKRTQDRPKFEADRAASGSSKHRVEGDKYVEEEEDAPGPKAENPYRRDRSKAPPKEIENPYISKEETTTTKKPAQADDEEYFIDIVYDDLPATGGNSRNKGTSKEIRDPPRVKPESKDNVRDREHRQEPVVRIVKRPFLPSRGGNPYSARGLQPVGSKAIESDEKSRDDRPAEVQRPSQKLQSEVPQENFRPNRPDRPPNKPRPADDIKPENILDDEVRSNPRGEIRHFPRTTQKPKISDNYRNPLDINENEYDVTLNDALNPTLPNLPIRGVPSGFSSERERYISQNYQRPRIVPIDSAVLSPAGSDFVYQIKQPQSTNIQETNSNSRYNPYAAVQQQLNYRHPSSGSGQYYSTYQ